MVRQEDHTVESTPRIAEKCTDTAEKYTDKGRKVH